jgi:tetratricopeptide (TPR) repeat protein
MKKVLFILFTFLLFTNTHGQSREIDSLNILLQNETSDTGRVLLLPDIAQRLLTSNPDTAMTLVKQGLEISRRIEFEKGEAKNLNIIGNVYLVLGNYTNAMAKYLEALKINESIHDLFGQYTNHANLGLVYAARKDFRLALNYQFKAQTIIDKLGRKRNIATNLRNIADTYKDMANYDSAIFFASQARLIASEIAYPRVIGASLYTLGEISFLKGENNLALEYSRLSIFPLKASANYFTLSESFLTMAKVFDALNLKDSVIFYAKESFKTAAERGFILPKRDAARFLSYYYREYSADSAFEYQDISRATNDSLFNQEKQRELQLLDLNEKMRQEELESIKLKKEEERKQNLQLAAIAIALITLLVLFFVFSRSIIVGHKFVRFFGILALLAVFEFINLFIHPYLDRLTGHSPILMLLILMGIGALLVPLHHTLQQWVKNQLVKKNKKFRLAAAKRIIAQLEG